MYIIIIIISSSSSSSSISSSNREMGLDSHSLTILPQSLISHRVSVDVKHHERRRSVYVISAAACSWCLTICATTCPQKGKVSVTPMSEVQRAARGD